jgi:hypothetical protein
MKFTIAIEWYGCTGTAYAVWYIKPHANLIKLNSSRYFS